MGLSSRQVTGGAHLAKTFGHVPIIAGVYDGLVLQRVQAAVVINLRKLHTLLCEKRAWCFSIVFDAATNHEDSIIDVWVHVSISGLIKNFLFLAIPV